MEDKKLQQTSKLTKSHVLVGYIYSGVCVFIFVFYLIGQFVTKSPSFFSATCETYEGNWVWKCEDGTDVVLGAFPTSIKLAEGESITVSTILPDDIKDNTYFCMLSSRSMIVYVDGKIRFSYDNNENPLGFSVKSRYMPVELNSGDAGKELVICRSDVEGNNGEFNQIIYGNALGVYRCLIWEQGGQFIFALFVLFFSCMTIICGYLLLLIFRRKVSLVLLAYGTAIMALWTIADSFIYQVVFQNFFVDGPLEYMLIMLVPFNFGRYINFAQERRYEKFFMFTYLLMLFDFILFTILHFAGIRSYQDNMGFISLSIAIVMVVYIGSFLVDLVRGYIRRYWMIAVGFAGVLIAGISQIVVLNVRTDVHSASFLLIGIFFLLIMGIAHTVIHMIHVEEKARHALQADKLKSSFLANMSHEIRTPINAVLGMNEMILRETDEEPIRRYAGDIQVAGESLLSIVNDILDFSKIESGRMEILEGEYFLGDVILNTVKMMRIRASSKDLAFVVDVDPKLPDRVFGDANRVQQILINLINNAIKYTEEGTVYLRIGPKEITAEEVTLSIEVEDTGIGIKEEDQDGLFQVFGRLELKKNRNIEGTGLGLAITKNLLELMGGSISVSSTYGKGSVFTVTLPQRYMGEATVGNLIVREEKAFATKRTEPVDFKAPDAKILVVDDIQVNLNIIKGLLKRSEMQVDLALSGEECLKKCAVTEYNLILMDHMMPTMDGIEALHALQKQWKEGKGAQCPVIVLTANAIEGMKEMYLGEGFSDYLAKPTKPIDLVDMILKYLPAEKVR